MSKYTESVDKCLDWAEKEMLSFNRGSVGYYERIRINIGRRVSWTRPDCNSEMARVLLFRGRERDKDIYENVVNWLLSVKDDDPLSAWYGSFPFYLYNGEYSDASGRARFQNDNGKVLIALMDMYNANHDERLKTAALKLADYWVKIQKDDGLFAQRDNGITQGCFAGPCFVLWLAAGIAMCYKATGDEKYKHSVEKAMNYLLPLQFPDGRLKTTFEIIHGEDWRPPSSETSAALFCFARIISAIDKPEYRKALAKAGDFVISLQHAEGGIQNADESCLAASLQENPHLCDLVYTQGFALMGLVEAFDLTDEERYRGAAVKLADFLVRIQCSGESPLWDGAWRGTYEPDKHCWDGRCSQNNPIDEGGMYSVYTGWCCAPICFGLLGTDRIASK